MDSTFFPCPPWYTCMLNVRQLVSFRFIFCLHVNGDVINNQYFVRVLLATARRTYNINIIGVLIRSRSMVAFRMSPPCTREGENKEKAKKKTSMDK